MKGETKNALSDQNKGNIGMNIQKQNQQKVMNIQKQNQQKVILNFKEQSYDFFKTLEGKNNTGQINQNIDQIISKESEREQTVRPTSPESALDINNQIENTARLQSICRDDESDQSTHNKSKKNPNVSAPFEVQQGKKKQIFQAKRPLNLLTVPHQGEDGNTNDFIQQAYSNSNSNESLSQDQEEEILKSRGMHGLKADPASYRLPPSTTFEGSNLTTNRSPLPSPRKQARKPRLQYFTLSREQTQTSKERVQADNGAKTQKTTSGQNNQSHIAFAKDLEKMQMILSLQNSGERQTTLPSKRQDIETQLIENFGVKKKSVNLRNLQESEINQFNLRKQSYLYKSKEDLMQQLTELQSSKTTSQYQDQPQDLKISKIVQKRKWSLSGAQMSQTHRYRPDPQINIDQLDQLVSERLMNLKKYELEISQDSFNPQNSPKRVTTDQAHYNDQNSPAESKRPVNLQLNSQTDKPQQNFAITQIQNEYLPQQTTQNFEKYIQNQDLQMISLKQPAFMGRRFTQQQQNLSQNQNQAQQMASKLATLKLNEQKNQIQHRNDQKHQRAHTQVQFKENTQLNDLIKKQERDTKLGLTSIGRTYRENGYNDFFAYVKKLNKKSKGNKHLITKRSDRQKMTQFHAVLSPRSNLETEETVKHETLQQPSIYVPIEQPLARMSVGIDSVDSQIQESPASLALGLASFRRVIPIDISIEQNGAEFIPSTGFHRLSEPVGDTFQVDVKNLSFQNDVNQANSRNMVNSLEQSLSNQRKTDQAVNT